MTVKKIAHSLHLWLGIPSGLLVFVIALTGCMYVFKAEIESITQPYRSIASQSSPLLPPSVLIQRAEEQLPGKPLMSLNYRPVGQAAEAFFYGYNPDYYYSVFIHPYTGEVLKIKDNRSGFFAWALKGHAYLWLPPHIGRPVVATATLVFVIVLLSGLILWIPKSKKAVKHALSFQWKKRTGIRRKMFDLHNVFGFYTLIIGLAVALTGLVWGFQWFSESSYWLTGGKKALWAPTPVSNPVSEAAPIHLGQAMDQVFERMRIEYPNAKVIGIQQPQDNQSAITATANASSKTYWKTEYRYFDRFTMRELPSTSIYGRMGDADAADKLRRMNYDIHVGAIGGLAGKMLLFWASLLIASLPVTGFWLWYKKRKRKNH